MMAYTLITGASSGIGYAAALKFAEKQHDLILVARNEDKLNDLKEKIKEQYKVDVVVKPFDLSQVDKIESFYQAIREKYELFTLVNNAGFGDYGPVSELELSKTQQMLHLNVEALTILSMLFVKDYEYTEGTQIINVSSVGGYLIVPENTTYVATKFYVSAFTEGLAHQLKQRDAKLQAKVLAPANTESKFAQVALDANDFDMSQIEKYHTADEMAEFMTQLYDSSKVLGIVNFDTFEFELRDPHYPSQSLG